MSVQQPAGLAAALAGCSQLTQLYLTDMEAPPELPLAERLPDLKRLKILNSSGLTDAWLESLAGLQLPSLKWLYISGKLRQHVHAIDIRVRRMVDTN